MMTLEVRRRSTPTNLAGLVAFCVAISWAAALSAFEGVSEEANLDSNHKTRHALSADVVVYGDTSGGVVAAVQAARSGKSVVLISPCGRLGGMTSSGLGWTDIGNSSILGGVAREFYHRVYLHYQDDSAWVFETRGEFKNQGQGAPALDAHAELASTFEPKVAEAVFNQLAAEASVRIVHGRIDLDDGVTKEGAKALSLRLEDGRTIQGKMFIDASYEGDLMAQAGVSFRIGRESRSEYDEPGNGITGPRHAHQMPDGVDPYVVPGDPSSGLLPGINPDMGGKPGDGDRRLQAFCYRMVLTNHQKNRRPIEKPVGYEEADYELLFRAIEAGAPQTFFTVSPIPNLKTDTNNWGGVSTDLIGGNYGEDWSWATLRHEQRDRLAAKHRAWQLGLLWTLQNHPRVPEEIRRSASVWGIARDEFVDNDNWPSNLYIREARRMVSDFVMTERHCRNQQPVPESIGMGAYTLDSHNTQRFVHNGMVKNEGDIQLGLKRPYPISYRAIIPKQDECENLLVPWALSATHIAFGSIRMEPVFMVLGQSAGTAACQAIDLGVTVQQVPYGGLRDRLLADGQVLSLPMVGRE